MADFLSFAIYSVSTDYSRSEYFAVECLSHVIVRTLGTGNVPEKQNGRMLVQ